MQAFQRSGLRLILFLYLFVAFMIALTIKGHSQSYVARGYDSAHMGWTPTSAFTQDSIAKKGLRLRTVVPLTGDAIGAEAQSLIAENLRGRDILLTTSMANYARGVNAHDGSGYWETFLGRSIDGSGRIDMHRINQHWGALPTGLYLPETGTYIQVAWISTDGTGTPESGRYFMFFLDASTGAITGKVDLQGNDNGMWKARASLSRLDVGGETYACGAHGSVFETLVSAKTGSVYCVNVRTKTLAANMTLPEGIWMGGGGMPVWGNNMYAITGNGDYDPAQGWLGEAFLRMQLNNNAISVPYNWAAWTDFQRTGQTKVPAEPKLAGENLASDKMMEMPVGGSMKVAAVEQAKIVAEVNAQGAIVTRVYPKMANGAWSDEDWGSAPPACIPAIKICIAIGKDGIAYPIYMDRVGGTTLKTVGTAANYKLLAGKCFWATMSPGNVPCDPADPRVLNFFPYGVTAHQHGTPAVVYDPVLKSWVVFVWGENARLHKLAVSPTGKITYIAEGLEYASADVRTTPPGGMPGGMCQGTGLKEFDGLLACSIPYGDANANIVNGRLLIYDPFHLDATGHLKVLWDSQRWGIPYVYNKFMPPLFWKDGLYLNNASGGIQIFN